MGIYGVGLECQKTKSRPSVCQDQRWKIQRNKKRWSGKFFSFSLAGKKASLAYWPYEIFRLTSIKILIASAIESERRELSSTSSKNLYRQNPFGLLSKEKNFRSPKFFIWINHRWDCGFCKTFFRNNDCTGKLRITFTHCWSAVVVLLQLGCGVNLFIRRLTKVQ